MTQPKRRSIYVCPQRGSQLAVAAAAEPTSKREKRQAKATRVSMTALVCADCSKSYEGPPRPRDVKVCLNATSTGEHAMLWGALSHGRES
jgi:hypothetical protein